MLEIKLFGTGQASYRNQPLSDFPNQQSFHLLCYLLLHRQYPHHREQLSTIFWGDYPTRIARKRLRNALWRLRKAFESIGLAIEEYLFIADETIAFVNTSDYWLDIEIFETQTEACKDLSGSELNADQVSHLEKAADLYVGDLLESVYEDWLLYERERFRISYLNALNKLMVYHGINGNYEHGLTYGEAILARDSTREKVHRQMMWLYCLAGNRNAALAQYKRCCEILLDELGIGPMLETQKIYESLLNDEFDSKTWPGDNINPLLAEEISDHSIRTLVRRALQKLHRLQETIEGTSEELHLIEQMISKALNQNPQSKKNIPE